MASELTQKRAPKWCLAQLDVTEKQRVGICLKVSWGQIIIVMVIAMVMVIIIMDLKLFLSYSCDSVKLIFSVQ